MSKPETTPESANCPGCNTKGRAVKSITIESLLEPNARVGLATVEGFRFCPGVGCNIAYFHSGNGATITKDQVRVRIGQKETSSPRPLCYCFNHTVEEVEAQIGGTGSSPVLGEIKEKCAQGLDRCPETNPQGSCCLGNVSKAIKEAQKQRRITTASPRAFHECCAGPVTPTSIASVQIRNSNKGMWATVGALGSAILSSACCWLPLLLIAFGASAVGISGFFESYRPYLLWITALLLGSGFYFAYFKKPLCKAGSACAVSDIKLQRFTKTMLWVATFVVVAFASFPNFLGVILGSENSSSGNNYYVKGALIGPAEPSVTSLTVRFDIEGMTCAGCAVGLASRLNSLPGILRATVDYDSKSATIELTEETKVESILKAISDYGFNGKMKR